MKVHGSLDVRGGFDRPFVHFQYQLDSGTVGGNMTAGAWNVRNLNTTVFQNNADMNNQSGGAMTLPAGHYYIEAYAATFRTGKNRLRVRDSGFNVVLLLGPSLDANTTDGNSMAYVGGRFHIGAATDVQVEHYITTHTGTSDAGTPTSASGISEVYADIKVWKISPEGDGIIA